MKTLTPFGVNDFLPMETEAFEKIQSVLDVVFRAGGFEKIKTPGLEYYDTLAVGMSQAMKDRAIKFFNHQGQLLVLRPDLTVPLARLVSARMADKALPIKLFYQDNIFRTREPHSTRHVEEFQSGVELYGDGSCEADAEVICCCIEAMKALDVADFVIEIGHSAFASDLDDDQRQALLEGDYVRLGFIPKRGQEEIAQEIPGLAKLYAMIKGRGLDGFVSFNKGIVKDLHHYTGVIFECFVKGVPIPIATGGRYDHLLGKFGFSCPAVGFAMNVSQLLKRSTL